jgi:hypothetical protein
MRDNSGMRAPLLVTLPLVLAGIAPGESGKVTAQKVIDDYLRAEGGAKALEQIQTEAIAGSLTEESTGQSGSYARIVQTPNRFYSEIVVEPEHDVDAYNGMSAWGEDSKDGVHTLSGADAKEVEAAGHYWNSRLVDLKKAKLTVQLLGMEQVGGRDAYRVQVTDAPGVTRDVFFDTQTHLIVRETGAGGQFDYGEYRPFNGIQTPYRMELHQGGHDYKISVTRVEFNSPVEASVFDFPKTAGIPLPDMKALFLDLVRNQQTLEDLRHQYTCHVTAEDEEVDSKGHTKSTTILEFEAFEMAEGRQVRRLLARDGIPLIGNEKKKEDERFTKEFNEQTKHQAELAADPKKQAKREEQEEANISDFLHAERFTNPRRERFRGQDVIAFDFGPNPDYKPKSTPERLVMSLAGIIWIDEQAHEVVRLEAHFSNAFKVGAGLLASVDKGSNFAFEQAKVNNEVWLPSYDEIHAAARVLLFHGKANRVERYTDYKKFAAQSKIVAVEQ